MVDGDLLRGVVSPERTPSLRGQSATLAVILLFGLVAGTAFVVLVAGGALVDGLEQQAEQEQALNAFDAATERITDASVTGNPRELPLGSTDDVDLDAVEGSTTLEFRAVNHTGGGTTIWACGDAETVELTALTMDLGADQRVFEGGAQYHVSDDVQMVRQDPSIAYEGGMLNVDLVDLDAEELHATDDPVARAADGEDAVDEAALAETLACLDDGELPHDDHSNDLELTIESEYAQAWDASLEPVFAGEPNVTYQPDVDADGSGEITIYIDGLIEPQEPVFEITDVDAPTIISPDTAESPNDFEAEVTVENTGSVEGTDTVELSVNPTDDADVDLEPDEDVTEPLRIGPGNDGLGDVPGIEPGDPDDLDQYGEYDYTVATADETYRSSFFYSYPKESLYRIEDTGLTTDGNTSTIATDLTNVGEGDEPKTMTVTLEPESDELEPWVWEEELETEPWNATTVEVEFNRSALPNDEYTWRVEVESPTPAVENENPDAFERTGTFEVEDGAVGDVDEIVVTEPSDVSVSIIGTEISAEGYWDGWYKYWGPVTASAVIGDTRYRFNPDGTTTEIPIDEPHHTGPGERIEDFNLNTFGTQTDVYEIEEAIEEGSITIEATFWTCGHGLTDHEVGQDVWSGNTYVHYECNDFGSPTTIDVGADDDASVDSGFLMTRDADRNELPDIEEGYPRQRAVQEVFEDGTDDVELTDDDELTLGENDFAFMMEVTMDQGELIDEYDDAYDGEYDLHTDDQTELNRAAWDVAQNYRHTNDETDDPNFNDVIGFVQVDPGETLDPDLDDPLQAFRIDGTANEPTPVQEGGADDTAGYSPGISVGVDTVHIG